MTESHPHIQQSNVVSLNTKWCVISLMTSIVLTLSVDYAESMFKNYTFYVTESFLFSSFWWLFIPIIYLQQEIFKRCPNKYCLLPVLFISILIHQLTYPATVWVFSYFFYPHTFHFWQTFEYGFNEYIMVDLVVFAASVGYFVKTNPIRTQRQPPVAFNKNPMRENMHTETIWITEGSKRIPVLTNEILYISASSPYVQLHINERKYLYKESLKSLMPQLDPNTFVRVHKSYIVNIRSVQSFQSRLNGDYDINLINGTQIRLSRNYSKRFKDIWKGGHRLTI